MTPVNHAVMYYVSVNTKCIGKVSQLSLQRTLCLERDKRFKTCSSAWLLPLY